MSTRTPNINLEKPGSDENYSIAVFNGNSDTVDTEMALRVKTSDIQNNLTSTATNKPLSAAQGKALNDGKVNVSDIQNNLTSTATNKPLSAAMGKSLSDTIATVSNTVANHFIKSNGFIPLLNNTSADSVKSAGMYYIQNSTGTPLNANGFLTVLPVSNSYIEQQFCSVVGEKYIRTCNNGTWTAWVQLAPYETGTWTAHIYDLDTKKFEVANQAYWKIGSIYICRLDIASFPSSNFATMFQIRNLPCNYVLGGTLYMANVNSQFGDKTIQATNAGRVYVRPNFTGSISGGICTGMFIGF